MCLGLVVLCASASLREMILVAAERSEAAPSTLRRFGRAGAPSGNASGRPDTVAHR